MPTLWRISNHDDLVGLGGEHTARWHTGEPGKRVVYLAEHPAVALLESFIHLKRPFVPATYQLLTVRVPDTLNIYHLDPSTLPTDWKSRLDVTRAIGDPWLGSNAAALLGVPSAVAPESWNYLLNPKHPDWHTIAVIKSERHPYDQRLFTIER